MSTAPIILAPEEEEYLLLYLAILDVTVSAVLLREEGGKQKPVFYTSKMLLDAETWYNSMEGMVLAMVTVKKKLWHYFESHTIVVMTNYPIHHRLSKPDLLRRLTKWEIELGVYEIKYVLRSARKGQVLANFLVEIQSFKPLEKEVTTLVDEKMSWVLNTNTTSNKNGVGIGIVLENSSGVLIEEAFRLEKNLTNNDAEYKAFFYGLKLALKFGAQYLKVNLDLELVFGQLIRIFEAKDPQMKLY